MICCAIGPDRALARYTADRLMLGAGQERPPLPALALDARSDPAGLWRDARALARPGDLLLCLDSGDGQCLAAAIGTARQAGLDCAAVVHAAIADRAPADADLERLVLPAAPREQLLTLQAMALGCFCHLIELNLFGA